MNKELLHQAINFLSRREYVNKELKRKLMQRDFSSSDIDEVMNFLVEKNYQSDIRAAECIFRNRVNKGYGWRYIENEMNTKGVGNDIIHCLYQTCETDWFALAENTYQKKFGCAEITDQKDKAKRMRFMQYRGFSLDEIFAVLPN